MVMQPGRGTTDWEPTGKHPLERPRGLGIQNVALVSVEKPTLLLCAGTKLAADVAELGEGKTPVRLVTWFIKAVRRVARTLAHLDCRVNWYDRTNVSVAFTASIVRAMDL
jgi:hypothetical protein